MPRLSLEVVLRSELQLMLQAELQLVRLSQHGRRDGRRLPLLTIKC